MTEIDKALSAANTILKGGGPAITPHQLNAAMLAIARIEKRDGETPERAFVRLLVEDQDSRMTSLNAACDALRHNDQARQATVAELIKSAEADLDEHVRASARRGEGAAAAYARLLDERDSTFLKYCAYLDRARAMHASS